MSGLFAASRFAGRLFAGQLFSGQLFAGRLFVEPAAASPPVAQASMYGTGSDDIASPWQQRRAKRIRRANEAAIALILAAISEDILQ